MYNFLPNFLKKVTGLLSDITGSIEYALTQVLDAGKLLKAQMMSNRISAPSGYYSSDQRQLDLILQGISRFLFKRAGESWNDFETRLSLFPFQVKDFGTETGLIRELGRTGLNCEITEEFKNPYRWVLLSIAGQCPIPEDQLSHIFSLDESDPYVGGTLIFDYTDIELFSFIAYLTGDALYSKTEVRQIIRFTKPAYTKCYCFYPGTIIAEVII